MSINKNYNFVIKFLKNSKIWHIISENTPAFSCRDAAHKRNRLGHTGIPLYDELKSIFGYYLDQNNNKQLILLHCRANRLIDFDKVNNVLNGIFQRLSKTELSNKYNLDYGLINPFIFARNKEIIQLFDKSVLENSKLPNTMMTNASDLRIAVEFRPLELIDIIKTSKVYDFTVPIDFKIENNTIGILTGNGPESGILLWQQINLGIRNKLNFKFRGDISFPKVLIESLPGLGLSMELDQRFEETRITVLNGIENLCNRGAKIIAVACNTTQFFTPEINEICSKFNAVHVSMPSSLEKYLIKNKIKHFDLVGIKYVIDLKLWSCFKNLKSTYKIEIPVKRI